MNKERLRAQGTQDHRMVEARPMNWSPRAAYTHVDYLARILPSRLNEFLIGNRADSPQNIQLALGEENIQIGPDYVYDKGFTGIISGYKVVYGGSCLVLPTTLLDPTVPGSVSMNEGDDARLTTWSLLKLPPEKRGEIGKIISKVEEATPPYVVGRARSFLASYSERVSGSPNDQRFADETINECIARIQTADLITEGLNRVLANPELSTEQQSDRVIQGLELAGKYRLELMFGINSGYLLRSEFHNSIIEPPNWRRVSMDLSGAMLGVVLATMADGLSNYYLGYRPGGAVIYPSGPIGFWAAHLFYDNLLKPSRELRDKILNLGSNSL